MARITAVDLDPILVDVANVDVVARAFVTFNDSDKDANTRYRMVATVVGHDPGGEISEDAADDVIANGTLTPNGGQVIKADGLSEHEFPFEKTLAKRDLDEDILHNPDDIKVRVTLTPIFASPAEADSNVRTLTA